MGSGLTPKQKRIVKELNDIYSLLGMDYRNIKEYPKEARSAVLESQKNQAIRGQIVMQYTVIDELMNNEICKYFFGSSKSSIQLWRTKKFQNFNYHILENLYLLQKLKMVQAFSRIPKNIVDDIERLNALRNAVTHAFFPENLRKYKPVYKGKDIFTLEGIKLFTEDMQHVEDFFTNRLKAYL